MCRWRWKTGCWRPYLPRSVRCGGGGEGGQAADGLTFLGVPGMVEVVREDRLLGALPS